MTPDDWREPADAWRGEQHDEDEDEDVDEEEVAGDNVIFLTPPEELTVPELRALAYTINDLEPLDEARADVAALLAIATQMAQQDASDLSFLADEAAEHRVTLILMRWHVGVMWH